MILLNSTSDILQLSTSSTASTDYYVAYTDITTTTFTPGVSAGNISSATDTTILSSPGASTTRQVKFLTLRNKGTSTNVVVLKYDVSGTEQEITADISLAAGEVLEYNDGTGFIIRARDGSPKQIDTTTIGYTGIPFEFYKIGTASEAVGIKYGTAKDSGLPGAWSPGAPGVNGWWTDASTQNNAANPAGASQTGSPRLQNPATGSYYLNSIGMTTSVAHLVTIYDLLWYNTGITVTTTTAQAITMPATSVPARDNYGTTNGEGWIAGIYVTTATTNAGAITNTTLSYTNTEGTAGRTATIASFPATAVAGTLVLFQLQAGDSGIQTIQSVTLGTTYGGGAISIVLLRNLASVPNPVVNVGGIMNKLTSDPTGVKIYNGTAFWLVYTSSATTATTLTGTLSVVER